MKIEEFKNLYSNDNLNEKVNKIIKEMNKDNLEKTFSRCQALLEFINVFFIEKYKNIKLEDYNITRIIRVYQKIDENLFEQMISINDTYNTVFENEIREEDVEYLLSKIDYIYGYIKEKYGDIV